MRFAVATRVSSAIPSLHRAPAGRVCTRFFILYSDDAIYPSSARPTGEFTCDRMGGWGGGHVVVVEFYIIRAAIILSCAADVPDRMKYYLFSSETRAPRTLRVCAPHRTRRKDGGVDDRREFCRDVSSCVRGRRTRVANIERDHLSDVEWVLPDSPLPPRLRRGRFDGGRASTIDYTAFGVTHAGHF